MSDGPLVIVTSPTLVYQPREFNPHCEAAKDFLLFMRAQGFGCVNIEVTDKGICIQGLRDDYPAAKTHSIGTPVGGGGVDPLIPDYDNPYPER